MNNFTHLEKYFDIALQELARTDSYSEIAWVIVVYLFSYLLAVKFKKGLPLLRGEARGYSQLETRRHFTLDIGLRYFVAAFAKGWGRYLHAAPGLATLSVVIANPMFNCRC